jgi:hypothetical protein
VTPPDRFPFATNRTSVPQGTNHPSRGQLRTRSAGAIRAMCIAPLLQHSTTPFLPPLRLEDSRTKRRQPYFWLFLERDRVKP